MADDRREHKSLNGKRVQIFLNTPLFRFRYVYNNEERMLMENAVRISGTIVHEANSGVLVMAHTISNMKDTESELPFDQIVVPYSKIDFMVLE